MEEFGKMKDFFYKLDEEEVLIRSEGNPYIDIKWLFTEKLDRKIISIAIENFMKKNNPEYEEKANRLKKLSKKEENKEEDNYTLIPGFEVVKYHDEIVLQAQGLDGWTKLNITDGDEKTYRGGIKSITVDQLSKEILEVINSKIIEEIVQKLKLEEEQASELKTIFKKKNLESAGFTLSDIKESLEQVWGNLVNYYKYLIQEKVEHSIHRCLVKHRTETGKAKTSNGGFTHRGERFYNIIPFLKRKKKLDEFQPAEIIVVEEINEDKTITNNAYIVFVYKNCLESIKQQRDGYLFVSEPYLGDRSTKLFYLSQDEFDNFKTNKGDDKFSKITEKYLSMSYNEFHESEGTAMLNHTDAENYYDRIDFFIDGNISGQITEILLNRLRNLYNDNSITLPYYTPRKIGNIGAGGERGIVDRTAQKFLSKNNLETGEQGNG